MKDEDALDKRGYMKPLELRAKFLQGAINMKTISWNNTLKTYRIPEINSDGFKYMMYFEIKDDSSGRRQGASSEVSLEFEKEDIENLIENLEKLLEEGGLD